MPVLGARRGLGDEIDRDETAATIAAAFLPEKEYENEFFTDGPRRVLAHLLKRKPQPRDILKMMTDTSRIELAVKGTPLAALLDAGAPAQRAGVLASLNMVADCLELLPEWEQPEFIERKLPETVPRSSPPTPVVRTEQPKTPAAAQATLPLFDAPTDRPTDKTKEAFVWDESKGIE